MSTLVYITPPQYQNTLEYNKACDGMLVVILSNESCGVPRSQELTLVATFYTRETSW